MEAADSRPNYLMEQDIFVVKSYSPERKKPADRAIDRHRLSSKAESKFESCRKLHNSRSCCGSNLSEGRTAYVQVLCTPAQVKVDVIQNVKSLGTKLHTY